MNRRVIVAAAVVLAALGLGVARSVSHQQPAPDGGSAVQPVVSVAPSILPAPSTSASAAEPARSEPVDEGSDDEGDDDATLGPGRDTGPDGQTPDPADAARWRPVATGFAESFTVVHHGDTTSTWRRRLSAYVTAAVDQQLGTVNVANVPSGRFSGLDVLQSSDEQISVQASYDPGWALVLYLVPDGTNHWKVSGYDRLEQ